MNKRNLVTVLAVAACVLTSWGVWRQREELAGLRAEQARRQHAAEAPAEPVPEETTATASQPADPAIPETPTPDNAVSSELLRLRNQVSRLSARQRELAGVVAEADQLRAQHASSLTNTAAGARLAPGYVRKANARLAGYATPEDTIQSFLWALQHRDFTNLLETMTPEAAQKMQKMVQQSGRSAEEFFKGSEAIPGFAIRGRENLPDGSVRLEMEVAPGVPTEKFLLQSVNGQWKLAGPF